MTRWTSICRGDHPPEESCAVCADFADSPRGGAAAFAGLALLAVLATLAVAGMFMAGRWVGDHAGAGDPPGPPAAAGTWCGQADEVVALNLDQGAAGELNGELSLGGRDFMVVAGRVEEGGIVTLQTVSSTLRFELDGALVAGRLRLNVTDDAGDTGQVELRHC